MDIQLARPTALRSIHAEMGCHNQMFNAVVNARASTAWVSANLVMYVPVPCPGPFRITKFACENGSAVSGNLDMGLYTPEGKLIVSTGSTAQAGTSQWQSIDVTDTEIPPGWYYLAMVLNNSTGTNVRTASATTAKRMFGCVEQTSTFPLPASATFAVNTNAYWPMFQAMGVTTL
jgi:hypothetical protein